MWQLRNGGEVQGLSIFSLMNFWFLSQTEYLYVRHMRKPPAVGGNCETYRQNLHIMKYLLIYLLSLAAIKSNARACPTSMVQLLNGSKWIVEYRITNVSKYHIIIEVTEVLKGDSVKSMTVNQYQDWACGSRIDKYKVGQTGIMFLEINENSGRNEIMGALNEGELIYKSAFIDTSSFEGISLGSGDFINFENKFNYSKEEIKNGVREYLKNRLYIEKLLLSRKLKSYKTTNPYLRSIIYSLEERERYNRRNR